MVSSHRASTLALVLAAAALAWVAAPSRATDVLVQQVAGKLAIGQSGVDDGGGFALGARVFANPFPSSFAVDQPGFNALPAGAASLPPGAGALPGGADLGWDFLPMHAPSLTSNLLYWNGAGATIEDVSFGGAPTASYSLSLFGRNGLGAAADGSDQLIAGRVIAATASTGFMHQHRFFFLDNDLDPNNATVAATGVYLVAMQLRMAGLENSDPFYLAFSTPGVPLATLNGLARPWIESNADLLIPPTLKGDYDGNGAVDGADLLVWQRELGDEARLAVWRENFGVGMALPTAASMAAVPEPGARKLIFAALLFACSRARPHSPRRSPEFTGSKQ